MCSYMKHEWYKIITDVFLYKVSHQPEGVEHVAWMK